MTYLAVLKRALSWGVRDAHPERALLLTGPNMGGMPSPLL